MRQNQLIIRDVTRPCSLPAGDMKFFFVDLEDAIQPGGFTREIFKKE